MGYFAKIDDGIVTQVISISNDVLGEPSLTFPDTDGAGRAFIANTLRLEGEWRQTSPIAVVSVEHMRVKATRMTARMMCLLLLLRFLRYYRESR
jgi:hypothetical protein